MVASSVANSPQFPSRYHLQRKNGSPKKAPCLPPTGDETTCHTAEKHLSAGQYELKTEETYTRHEEDEYHPQNDCHCSKHCPVPQRAEGRFSGYKSPTYQEAKSQNFRQRNNTVADTKQRPLHEHESANGHTEFYGLPN